MLSADIQTIKGLIQARLGKRNLPLTCSFLEMGFTNQEIFEVRRVMLEAFKQTIEIMPYDDIEAVHRMLNPDLINK